MPPKVAVIYINAIGDYILMRNFFDEIKKSEKYKNAEITFIGNLKCKNIALALDGAAVKESAWLNTGGRKGLFYRLDGLLFNFYFTLAPVRRLKNKNFDVVLTPSYNRRAYNGLSAGAARILNAPEKIISWGDAAGKHRAPAAKLNKYYTRVLETGSRVNFETRNYNEFFSEVLEKKVNIGNPFITGVEPAKKGYVYAILCPSSAEKNKNCPPGPFAAAADFLAEKYNIRTLIMAAGGDDALCAAVAGRMKSKPEILIGADFKRVLEEVAGAAVTICNDSAPMHVSAALGVPAVAVSTGKAYLRSLNYPDKTNLKFVFPRRYLEMRKEKDFYKRHDACARLCDITEVTAEQVVEAVGKILKEKNII